MSIRHYRLREQGERQETLTLPKAFDIKRPPYNIAERKASSCDVHSASLRKSEGRFMRTGASYPASVPPGEEIHCTGVERCLFGRLV